MRHFQLARLGTTLLTLGIVLTIILIGLKVLEVIFWTWTGILTPAIIGVILYFIFYLYNESKVNKVNRR